MTTFMSRLSARQQLNILFGEFLLAINLKRGHGLFDQVPHIAYAAFCLGQATTATFVLNALLRFWRDRSVMAFS